MSLRLKIYFRNGQKLKTIVEFPIARFHNRNLANIYLFKVTIETVEKGVKYIQS